MSLQLMRRFIQVNEYGINKWPKEYVIEFTPLIISSRYCKGSLIHTALKTAAGNSEALCVPLRPIYECAFSPDTKPRLCLCCTLFLMMQQLKF